VQPVGGALLLLRPVAEARRGGADVLVGPLPGEDPLVQAAGGQDVLLVHAAQRRTENTDTLMSCQAGSWYAENVMGCHVMGFCPM